MNDQVLPHALHATVAGVGLALLAWAGITPEVMSANGWWVTFVVANVGVFVGNVLAARLGDAPADAVAITLEGRRQDLIDSHGTVVELLRNLDVERPKLTEAEYTRQREALIAVGAAALRALEEEAPPAEAPASAPPLTAQLRALREADPAAFDAALADLGLRPAVGISGEWRGALYTLLGVALVAGLWFSVGGSAKPRPPGGSMTGGDDVAPEIAQDPRLAEVQAALAKNPDDVVALNQLTELAIGNRDLQTALQTNQRVKTLAPDDADGKVFGAVLKAFIGRTEEALVELDQIAVAHADNPRVFIFKGLLTLDRDPVASVAAFERAVQLDDSPQLKAALEEARRRAAGGPPPGAPPGEVAPPAQGAPPEVIVSGTLTAPEGAVGQVVFVNVRDPAGGPPLAAVRLPPGPFPMAFTITTADRLSMGGNRPLPAGMVLSARLDADGNATSKAPEEPAATAEGVAPGATGLQLTLAPQG